MENKIGNPKEYYENLLRGRENKTLIRRRDLIMLFLNKYADSDGNKVHYLDNSNEDDFMTSLVYVPGALNCAEQTIELLSELHLRRCIAMSLRGRGKNNLLQSHFRNV